jgi:hypothetical protein
MTLRFLGHPYETKETLAKLINDSHSLECSLFIGPELNGSELSLEGMHDIDHLIAHLTCSAVLPVVQNEGISINPLTHVQKWCDECELVKWQDLISWKNAWFEGNNILFVGQLLLYLRDVEKIPEASEALERWFKWLDEQMDPETSLWGTNGYCSNEAAVYGGYHQLLLYWHEERPLANPKGLIDVVLGLQHLGGRLQSKRKWWRM